MADINRLLADSSLGTPGARQLRRRTPTRVREQILRIAADRRKMSDPGPSVCGQSDSEQIQEQPVSDNDRHVQPNPDGGWDVQKPGSSRASVHTDTQADAINRARQIVHNAGGGEVVIHGRDGRIRDKDTIAPGNDPFPPRDRR